MTLRAAFPTVPDQNMTYVYVGMWNSIETSLDKLYAQVVQQVVYIMVCGAHDKFLIPRVKEQRPQDHPILFS